MFEKGGKNKMSARDLGALLRCLGLNPSERELEEAKHELVVSCKLFERICTLYDLNIGDEYHYILECGRRRKCVKGIFIRNPNIITFKIIINTSTNTHIEY
jgi:hypothetical protein